MNDNNLTPASQRWTSELLDRMRGVGDPEADAVIAELFAKGEVGAVNALLQTLVKNDGLPSPLLPEIVRSYLAQTRKEPLASPAELERAQNLFALVGPEMLLTLGFYSLPASYAARKGVQVIYRTAFLQKRPIRRVFETTQMVIDVLSPGGLSPEGRGLVTSQKVRLMHAAVRHQLVNDSQRPWDRAELGVPVNQEDLAGTLMTFAYLVLDGLTRLGVKLEPADQEAYLRTWVSIALILGVREELLPANVAEARLLTEIIYKRQIAASPEGVALTKALIDGMETLVPLAPLKGIPAALIQFFLGHDTFTGQDIASLLEVPDAKLPHLAVAIIAELGDIAQYFSNDPVGGVIRFFTRHMMQGLLDVSRGGSRSPFYIPPTLQERWGMPGNN